MTSQGVHSSKPVFPEVGKDNIVNSTRNTGKTLPEDRETKFYNCTHYMWVPALSDCSLYHTLYFLTIPLVTSGTSHLSWTAVAFTHIISTFLGGDGPGNYKYRIWNEMSGTSHSHCSWTAVAFNHTILRSSVLTDLGVTKQIIYVQ